MTPGRGRAPGASADRRRRTILAAVGLLIFLGTAPVAGPPLAGGLDRLLGGADHLGALCLVALHAILTPLHHLFLALLAAGTAYAAWDRIQAARLLRRTLAPLAWEAPSPGGAVARAAADAGVDPAIIRVARGLPVPAFTAGWLRPRVYLALELAERLSPPELAAVVAHEGAHAARRDPLCLAMLRFVAHALFWIPVLRRLVRDCADEVEIRADDAARLGRPLALASALLAVAEWGLARAERIGVGIHHPDLLARRVRRLAGEEAPPRSHVTRRSRFQAGGALALVWLTGIVAAHPLPVAGPHPPHCEHRDSAAWTHLLCARTATAPAACPHEPA